MTIQTVARIETYNNQVIDFLQIDKEYRIDSRDVAPNIDIEHKHFVETLRTYQGQLEHFGVVPFETAKPPKGSAGGRPETYVMLNRNQVLFAITLSRNTEQVVAWKMALIDALDQIEKQVMRPCQIASSRSMPCLRDKVMEEMTNKLQSGEKLNSRAISQLGASIMRKEGSPAVRKVLDSLAGTGQIGKSGYGRCALYWLLTPMQ